MSKLNLHFGNPDFLFPYWEKKNLQFTTKFPLSSKYPLQTEKKLKTAIKNLHDLEKNCNYKGKYLLIGNSANQLLSAVSNTDMNHTYICAKAPYYSRFKYLIDNTTTFHEFSIEYSTYSTEIVTTPNNPTNEVILNFSNPNSIFDLCYNWSHYTNPINYNADIMLFSTAKALGLPDLRISWAWIKNKKTYLEAKEYLENSTLGVSVYSQLIATQAINESLGGEIFKFGKSVLNERWKKLLSLKLKNVKLLNNSGMYIWGEKIKPLHKDIKYLSGEVCGSDSKHFRLNVGCSEKDFKQLLKLLK